MPPVGFLASSLVGRERELTVIHSLLERGGALLIAGEAGIGKSRLVREAMSTAKLRGFAIMHGQCFDRDQVYPFAPFLDLARGHLATTDDHAQFSTMAPRLLRLLPEYQAPPLPRFEPEEEQRRVFIEVAAFTAAVATARPLLIVVEDLHWSDESSLDLLLLLLRRRAPPTTIILTYRSDEGLPALNRFLAEIDRGRLAAEVAPSPLTPPETGRLVSDALDLPRPPSALFVRSLHDLTGGNPYFIEEVLRALIAAGDVFPSPEGWQRKPLDRLQVPRSVDDAVRRRTASLGPAAQRILTLAAVAGRHVEFALLQALSGLGESELLNALKEAIGARLMVEVTADTFAFRHALTQQAIYGGLLVRERRSLHALVAAELERNDAVASAGDLAYHHFKAEHWERAGLLAQRAGDRARALYAPQAAIEQYTLALDAAAHLVTPPNAPLLLARGEAFDALGDFSAARADYERALAAAESNSDRAAELAAMLAMGFLWSGRDYAQALAWLQRSVTLARSLADPAALGLALNRLGNWHANNEDIDEALRCHEEALALFARSEDRRGLAQTYDLIAMTRTIGGDLAGGRDAARHAIPLFTALGDRQGLAGCAIMSETPASLFEVATMAGGATIAAAIAAVEHSLQIARDIGWRSGETYFLSLLGETWATHGDFARALAVLAESISIAEEIDHRQWRIQARYALGETYGAMFAHDRQRTELTGALALAQAIGSRFWLSAVSGAFASALTRTGDTGAAADLLRDVLRDDTPMRTQGQRQLWTARVELALARKQPDEALAIANRLFATTLNLAAEGDVPLLAERKAMALAALGRLDEAVALLRAAQTTADREGALPRLFSLHQELARVHERAGDIDAAAAETAVAHAIGQQLAATIPDENLRRGFLQTAGLAEPATASERRARGEGLTPREREVADQVAAGRSNRQIAGALFVSERTVETHVANILRKLDLSSRAGIATWATRSAVTADGT